MTSLGLAVTKTGMLFSAGREAIIYQTQSEGVAAGVEYLAPIIRAAAPVATGTLAKSIRPAGRGLARRVRAGIWQAIPIDKGYVSKLSTPVGPLERWAMAKGFSAQEARRLAYAIQRSRRGQRHPGAEFFYKTFDREAATIYRKFLEPIGVAIREKLS